MFLHNLSKVDYYECPDGARLSPCNGTVCEMRSNDKLHLAAEFARYLPSIERITIPCVGVDSILSFVLIKIGMFIE